jgi:putative tryptophan/tyrosine transport system substrate-binding protein
MRRREFIAGLAAAVAWPLVARAQQGDRMRRVGVLTNFAEDDPTGQGQLRGFRQGLEYLGWTEGRNVRIDYRYARGANVEASRPLAKELIALRPDVVFAPQSNVTGAMRQESATIPVVFAGIADPISLGLIVSLARPGGRFTGLMLLEGGSIFGKWLAMLKEIAPNVTHAALMFDPKVNSNIGNNLAPAMTVARALGIELVQSHVETAADIERTIETVASRPHGGIVQVPDTTAGLVHRDLIIGLTARHRLPTVYSSRLWVQAGGLVSYGADSIDMHRQAAYYVDRILRGTPPADLPVQLPTKYETILNLRTAKALGLVVPPTLLVRADEVIE